MRSRKEYLIIRSIYAVIDLFCVFLAFYLVCWSRRATLPFTVDLSGFLGQDNPFKSVFLLWAAVVLFFNQTHGLYKTHREQMEGLEIWEVVKSIFVSTLVIITLAYLFKIQDFPRGVMILNALVIALFCSIWRVFKKLLVNYLARRGYNNFNAVIIGAGKVGVLLAEEIKKRPALGVKIVGFLDDYKTGTCGSGPWPVLGRIDQFAVITPKSFINKMFITIHHNSDVFVRLLEQARGLGVAVRVVPQGYEWMVHDPAKYNIGIIPVLEYWDVDVNYRLRAKRFFDLCLAWIIFLFLSPVLAVIAVRIKLDSPGPVFYKSRRYGLCGKVFPMYKFRSMVCNAEEMLSQLKDKNEVDGPIFKIRKDPRVTKFGTFLRKYSLDELPQIFNVIKGDMSLVGPRPLPVEQIEKEDLQQFKRLEVRPGITGLWQIRGRSDLPFVRLVKWDIWYINNWSFGLDLYILFQTLPVVLKGKGAY